MSLAIAAAMRGVDVIVVEPRAAGAPPSTKCNSVSSRTLEIFRQFGVSDAVRAAGLPDDYPTDTLYATSLTGPEITRLRLPSRNERSQPGFLDSHWATPEPVVRVSQYFLEPILFERMRRAPEITVLNGVRVERYEHTETGVTVHCRADEGGEPVTVKARFLAGCDGGRSTIRKAMGVQLLGDAEIAWTRSTLVKAPHMKALFGKRRPAWMTWTVNHEIRGNVVAIDGRDMWLVHRALPRGCRDFEALHFDRSIRAVLGVGPDFTWDVLHHEDWVGRRLVADRFRDRNVFLAGDAAHIWIPYAGYGMNAGIADGVNLAWVLSAVCNGWAPPAILDAYEAERRPITEQVSQLAMRKVAENVEAIGRGDPPRALAWRNPVGAAVRAIAAKKLYAVNVPQFAPEGLNFGYFYEGSPIIAYDGEAAPAYSMGEVTPSTVPGCRMPHFWLDGGSVYDRLGLDYTLVRFDPAADVSALTSAASEAGLPLVLIDAPRQPATGVFRHRLLIVRHDQMVAWRGDDVPADPRALVARLQARIPAAEAPEITPSRASLSAG
jgi:2-polyprenyl-6-methoxyphenol hydroxylase-like FAD-dependent oxidoreductase